MDEKLILEKKIEDIIIEMTNERDRYGIPILTPLDFKLIISEFKRLIDKIIYCQNEGTTPFKYTFKNLG